MDSFDYLYARRVARTNAIVVNAILSVFGFIPVMTWAWPLEYLVDGIQPEEGLTSLWLMVNVAYLAAVIAINWVFIVRLNLTMHDLVGLYARTSCLIIVGSWSIMAMYFFNPIRPWFMPDSWFW